MVTTPGAQKPEALKSDESLKNISSEAYSESWRGLISVGLCFRVFVSVERGMMR